MSSPASPVWSAIFTSSGLRWAGLILTAMLALIPLIAEPRPVDFLLPSAGALAAWGSRLAVLLALFFVVALRAWADRRSEERPGLLNAGLALLAALMTAWHWYWVDVLHVHWQQQTYWEILNFEAGPPHQFRALPYGFTRLLERVTGDWSFACVTYRWFFTWWFVWAYYHFVRLFQPRNRALLALVPLAVLYPMSVLRYWGQLTDPLSHALLTLSLIYAVQDRWVALAAAVGLGVLAKETAVVIIPAYFLCHWRQGLPLFVKTALVTAVAAAAFLGARLPMGWRPGATINGVDGLMIGTNLGIGKPLATTFVSLPENYLHPALFVLPFLPFIAWNWRRSDRRLRALFVVLTPLMLFANLCYGWMYESRNYVPLLPVLTALALPAGRTATGDDEPAP